MSKTSTVLLFMLFSLLFEKPLKAQVVVKQYFYETQKHRKSTRFTILEWLKIKQRIKEMDLWLALVSDPKKDKFKPELEIGYDIHRFKSLNTPQNSSTFNHYLLSRYGTFYLTNILTSTLKINWLNIDLGIHYNLKELSEDESYSRLFQSSSLSLDNNGISFYKIEKKAIELRVFGKHIQDTSVSIKIGEYKENLKSSLLQSDSSSERFYGVSGKVYLFSFLAVTGELNRYEAKKEGFSPFIKEDSGYGLLLDLGYVGIKAAVSEVKIQEDLSSFDKSYKQQTGGLLGISVFL